MSEEWVPVDACTLPTSERPLRVAEYDGLFAARLLRVARRSATAVELVLRDGPGVRDQVTDLTAREAACCSFFSFDVQPGEGELVLSVGVPEAYADTLAALVERADAAVGESRDQGRWRA